MADEAWKVTVAGRDVYRVDELLSGLVYYLMGPPCEVQAGLGAIRRMSGAHIVDALEAYKAGSVETVRRGLAGRPVVSDPRVRVSRDRLSAPVRGQWD